MFFKFQTSTLTRWETILRNSAACTTMSPCSRRMRTFWDALRYCSSEKMRIDNSSFAGSRIASLGSGEASGARALPGEADMEQGDSLGASGEVGPAASSATSAAPLSPEDRAGAGGGTAAERPKLNRDCIALISLAHMCLMALGWRPMRLPATKEGDREAERRRKEEQTECGGLTGLRHAHRQTLHVATALAIVPRVHRDVTASPFAALIAVRLAFVDRSPEEALKGNFVLQRREGEGGEQGTASYLASFAGDGPKVESGGLRAAHATRNDRDIGALVGFRS